MRSLEGTDEGGSSGAGCEVAASEPISSDEVEVGDQESYCELTLSSASSGEQLSSMDMMKIMTLGTCHPLRRADIRACEEDSCQYGSSGCARCLVKWSGRPINRSRSQGRSVVSDCH